MSGKITDEAIHTWLQGMDMDQRRELVDTLYRVVDASQAELVTDLIEDWRDSAVQGAGGHPGAGPAGQGQCAAHAALPVFVGRGRGGAHAALAPGGAGEARGRRAVGMRGGNSQREYLQQFAAAPYRDRRPGCQKPNWEVRRAEALRVKSESSDMCGGFGSLARQGFLTPFPAREPRRGERKTAQTWRKRPAQPDFFDTLCGGPVPGPPPLFSFQKGIRRLTDAGFFIGTQAAVAGQQGALLLSKKERMDRTA